MRFVRIVGALGWYLLPAILTLVVGIISGFWIVLFVAVPFQTTWIPLAGLSVPRRIAPKWLLSRLECNLLNVDYVLLAANGD